MVAPISNDKILPSDANRTSTSESKGSKTNASGITTGSHGGATSAEVAVNSDAATVDLDRANQVYSQSQAQASSKEGEITTPEQALSLVADIRQQIEADGALALQAQTGSVSNSALALLEASPA